MRASGTVYTVSMNVSIYRIASDRKKLAAKWLKVQHMSGASSTLRVPKAMTIRVPWQTAIATWSEETNGIQWCCQFGTKSSVNLPLSTPGAENSPGSKLRLPALCAVPAARLGKLQLKHIEIESATETPDIFQVLRLSMSSHVLTRSQDPQS